MPAAAVIHRLQALSGFTGCKTSAGGFKSPMLKAVAQQLIALETISLECSRELWNSMWSGGMRRYMEEH